MTQEQEMIREKIAKQIADEINKKAQGKIEAMGFAAAASIYMETGDTKKLKDNAKRAQEEMINDIKHPFKSSITKEINETYKRLIDFIDWLGDNVVLKTN